MTKTFKQSDAYYERALRTIPQASQTVSKSAENFVKGAYPLFIDKGEGAKLFDVDGNEYIDYILGLCPIILGYCDEDVDAAIRHQLDRGIIFSLASPLEAELAERLCHLIPCAEKVRFAKNGSDATSGAVRLARAHTDRDRIAICGYHGWHDWYIGSTAKRLGVPDAVQALSSTFDFNDADSLEALLADDPKGYAAIILEPAGVEAPEPGFLEAVRSLADKYGAVLIFDEIVTGFRMNLGGAQAEYGVAPDLASFGKSMANGMPISALVGKAELMDVMTDVFVSGTFGGETLSIAAALATIDKLEATDTLSKIRMHGARLRSEINSIFHTHGLNEDFMIKGDDWRPVLKIQTQSVTQPLAMSLLRQELAEAGVIFGSGFNMCLAHCDTNNSILDQTISAWDHTAGVLAKALSSPDPAKYLRGEPMAGAFQVRKG